MNAVSGTRRGLRELADGTLRVQIDIDPSCKDTFLNLFREIDMPVALAPLEADFERHAHGDYAKALRLSGFFRIPDVWEAIGTDDDYLDWIRQQACCRCKHRYFIEAAHVRRVANGAGTGIKPRYSAIPLCRKCHALQHQKGESAIGGSEFIDRQRIQHIEQWAWEALKAKLDYQHWYDVPPPIVRDWAKGFGLDGLLPEANDGHQIAAEG